MSSFRIMWPQRAPNIHWFIGNARRTHTQTNSEINEWHRKKGYNGGRTDKHANSIEQYTTWDPKLNECHRWFIFIGRNLILVALIAWHFDLLFYILFNTSRPMIPHIQCIRIQHRRTEKKSEKIKIWRESIFKIVKWNFIPTPKHTSHDENCAQSCQTER